MERHTIILRYDYKDEKVEKKNVTLILALENTRKEKYTTLQEFLISLPRGLEFTGANGHIVWRHCVGDKYFPYLIPIDSAYYQNNALCFLTNDIYSEDNVLMTIRYALTKDKKRFENLTVTEFDDIVS